MPHTDPIMGLINLMVRQVKLGSSTQETAFVANCLDMLRCLLLETLNQQCEGIWLGSPTAVAYRAPSTAAPDAPT